MVILVWKHGILLLDQKWTIVLVTCQNSEWSGQVVPVDLVLKQVNSIPCEVYPLVIEMLVVTLLREMDPVKVLVQLHLECLLRHMSQVLIVSSTAPQSSCAYNSIFRNESEAKDDESHKVIAPDDEVAEGGYYTIPPIKKVASTASVPNFVIVRKGYGSISFKSPVDLTGITSLSGIREIVHIERGRVTVYPDESEHVPAGTGLNVPAEVTMDNLRPPADVELEKFTEELRSKPNTEFESYNSESGVWVFRVQHFSTIEVGGCSSDYYWYPRASWRRTARN